MAQHTTVPASRGVVPRPPVRRIVDVQTYIVAAEEVYYELLSCGHIGNKTRPKTSIEKDVAARRRVVCRCCQSDV